MSTFRFTNRSSLVGLAGAIAAAATFAAAPVLAGDCCSRHNGSGGGHDHASHGTAQQHADHRPSQTRPASIATQPPHGGQVHATDFQYFEVVYLPRETRVHLYGIDQRPVSARNVQGQIAMQVRGYEKVFRYPLTHVAGNGAAAQDYLAATVDVSRVRDGDMRVSFYLANLPYQQQPQVSFAQTFALSRARPAVTTVALNESDRAGIARQGTCPVTGGGLGSMGTPVKVMAGGQSFFLCCRGCVGKVEENPAQYLAKAAELLAGR